MKSTVSIQHSHAFLSNEIEHISYTCSLLLWLQPDSRNVFGFIMFPIWGVLVTVDRKDLSLGQFVLYTFKIFLADDEKANAILHQQAIQLHRGLVMSYSF